MNNNDEKIVNHLINYIEESEKELQATAVVGDKSIKKADIVNAIIKELESAIENEN